MPIKLITSGGGSAILTPTSKATDYTLTVPAVTANVVTTGDSGSITQTMLGSGVVGTGPAFAAYLNADQSLSYATWTKIQYNTKEFDTNNNYDSTTNYRFTPTVAGYYLINASWFMLSGGSVYSYIGIYKNGSIFKSVLVQNSSGISTPISSLIYFNGSTDYVEIYANFTTTNNKAYGSQAHTFFQGYLVRSA